MTTTHDVRVLWFGDVFMAVLEADADLPAWLERNDFVAMGDAVEKGGSVFTQPVRHTNLGTTQLLTVRTAPVER